MRHILMAFLLMAGQAAANPLAGFEGEARPILIFAPDRYDERLTAQKGRFAMHRREYRDRDITLVEIGGPFMRADGRGLPHGPELRERYGVAPGTFAVILIGKDGEEKLRVTEVTDPQVFYQLIDTMPLRQEEIRQRGG